MAKFANDCLHKSREIIKELTPTLGEDTSELEMRIGIHSGEVTGGVLRGQKSRFQLFGDVRSVYFVLDFHGLTIRPCFVRL